MPEVINEQLQQVFAFCAETPNLAADSALVAALPALDDPLRRVAVDTLLERGNVTGLTALVAGFNDYDPPLRESLIERVNDLFEATRAAITSDNADARLGAVELISTSANYRQAYLLGDALSSRCPRTISAATSALVSMARRVIDRRSVSNSHGKQNLALDTKHLVEALASALDRWQLHFRPEVLKAAMMLVEFTEKMIFEKVSQTRSNVARAIVGVLRGECGPELAPFVLRALRHPELRAAATEQIAARSDPEFVAKILDSAWVLTDRDTALACGRIKELPWITDDGEIKIQLSDETAVNALNFISFSGLRVENKLSVYRRWLHKTAPRARETALWNVTRLDTEAARQLLERTSEGDDPSLASIAELEIFRRSPQDRTERKPTDRETLHESAANAMEASFENFWDRADDADERTLRQSAESLMAKSPDRFAQNLRAHLAGPNAVHRLKALSLAKSLNIAREYENDIYALSSDSDDRVRSQAVSLLSEVEGATAMRVLRQALNDPHHRVQANAVDVIAGGDATSWEKELVRKLGDQNNRVSANAIRALLRRGVREAAVTLVAMLKNPSPAHRVSAIWVVEQLGLVSLMPRLRELSAEDPDPRVRERAERVLSQGVFADAVGAGGDEARRAKS